MNTQFLAPFAALGPGEFFLVVVVFAVAGVGLWRFSRINRALRMIEECHQMLTQLLRDKRE